MIKQLLLVVTGDFNHIEYKNLVTDKIAFFNLQSKAIDTPDIRCKTRAESEDRMAILLEGEETEVQVLATAIKRGPLTAHITSVEEKWREVKPETRAAEQGGERPGGRKRRRRRRK